MVLIVIALIVIAFLVGWKFGDQVADLVARGAKWLWGKIVSGVKTLWGKIFKKGE
jgi:hypothetical protein